MGDFGLLSAQDVFASPPPRSLALLYEPLFFEERKEQNEPVLFILALTFEGSPFFLLPTGS